MRASINIVIIWIAKLDVPAVMLKAADEMTRGFRFIYDGVSCDLKGTFPSAAGLSKSSSGHRPPPLINGASIAGVS